MGEFYEIDLRDGDEGVALLWRRKDNLCTYTRELTVDLPDIDNANLAEQGDEEYCENCGRPMVLKKGRFGTFFACSGYPDCKTTKQIGGAQKKSDVILDEKCPQCGNNMVQKFGRFGEFTACSNYPGCKYGQGSKRQSGVKCPELLRKAKLWSAVPSAARRFTVVIVTRIAISWPGPGPFRRSARNAEVLI